MENIDYTTLSKQEKLDYAETAYREGNSIKSIAKIIHMSPNTISPYLKSLGIEIKVMGNVSGSKQIKVNEDKFNKIDNEYSAYFLGFLYADGSIRLDRNEITLDLKDRDIIESFHIFMESKNSIREHKTTKNGKDYLSFVSGFSSAKVKEDLIRLGCTPKKSLTLNFPNEDQVPNSMLTHFLRGYVDGDGYLRWENNKHDLIILGTEQFLWGIRQRLNWNNEWINIIRDPSAKSDKVFKMCIYKKEVVKEKMRELYENSSIYLQRKYDIYLKSK